MTSGPFAECWRALPEDLRYGITRAYVRGTEEMTAGLGKALAAAHSWMLATFGGQDKPHDPGRWERLVRYVRERDVRRLTEGSGSSSKRHQR